MTIWGVKGMGRNIWNFERRYPDYVNSVLITKRPEWDRVPSLMQWYPEEFIRAIKEAGLSWLVIDGGQVPQDCFWVDQNFISLTNWHPEQQPPPESIRTHYTSMFDRFYRPNGPYALGRYILKYLDAEPFVLYIRFLPWEIDEVRSLTGILIRTTGIRLHLNPNENTPPISFTVLTEL